MQGAVVNVSGWRDEDKQGNHYKDYFPKATSYTITNYSGESGYQGTEGEIPLDLREPLPPELKLRFDAALCHTVLEHIFDVKMAFANLASITRDLLIVIVPFCQNQHELASFADYWRFTPSCLRSLYSQNGMTVIFESSNEDFASANYLFFVGTHHLERYSDLLRAYGPLGPQGRWIGNSWWQKALPKLWVGRWSWGCPRNSAGFDNLHNPE